jgi:hypothetical protein
MVFMIDYTSIICSLDYSIVNPSWFNNPMVHLLRIGVGIDRQDHGNFCNRLKLLRISLHMYGIPSTCQPPITLCVCAFTRLRFCVYSDLVA